MEVREERGQRREEMNWLEGNKNAVFKTDFRLLAHSQTASDSMFSIRSGDPFIRAWNRHDFSDKSRTCHSRLYIGLTE